MSERCRRHALTYCDECHGGQLTREERAEFNAINREYATPIVQLSQDEYRALRDALAAAEARAVRCEGDGARLDWLEAKGCLDLSLNGVGQRPEFWDIDHCDRTIGTGSTLRAAIDAAIAAERNV